MPAPAVYIAGIGLSSSMTSDLNSLAVSAATKALLDSGITYAKVELSIACFLDDSDTRIPRTCFKAFGRQRASLSEIDIHSALSTAVQCVQSGQTNCALLVGADSSNLGRGGKASQVAAVGIVLVSDRFMTSHAYLKDSAVQIKACNSAPAQDRRLAVQDALRKASLDVKDLQMVETQGSASPSHSMLGFPSTGTDAERSNDRSPRPGPLEAFGLTGWVALCSLVWRLRGWTQESHTNLPNCMQYISKPEDAGATVLILCRSDGKPAPSYADVRYLRDGRERLGHNPAEQMQEIVREDLEAVKSREGDRMLTSDFDEADRLRLGSRGGDRAALARL